MLPLFVSVSVIKNITPHDHPAPQPLPHIPFKANGVFLPIILIYNHFAYFSKQKGAIAFVAPTAVAHGVPLQPIPPLPPLGQLPVTKVSIALVGAGFAFATPTDPLACGAPAPPP